MESLKTRLGKKTLEARHIAKAYGDRKLIEDFSYIVLPRDRIGIVGKNGSGKSTLVKLLCGLGAAGQRRGDPGGDGKNRVFFPGERGTGSQAARDRCDPGHSGGYTHQARGNHGEPDAGTVLFPGELNTGRVENRAAGKGGACCCCVC